MANSYKIIFENNKKWVEEKLNISRAVFIFLHGLVTIYSSDYQECPEWVRQMLLDYLHYTILRKKI